MHIKRRRSLVTPLKPLVVALCTLLATDISAADDSVCFGPGSAAPYSGRLDIGGYYQNHDQSYDQIDVMLPVLQNRQSLLFLDLRGTDVQGPAFEGNAGLGYRQISADNSMMYGVYGFYDRRRSDMENYFNQITVGGEVKTMQWSYGANVYMPIGSKAVTDHSYDNVGLVTSTTNSSLQNIVYTNGQEKALPGADAEIGYTPSQFNNLTTYLGGYYFKTSDVPTISGPRARITYDIPWLNTNNPANYVRLESQVQYDNVRGTQWAAGLRFSFGFGGNKTAKLTGIERRMLDYVQRDYNIVTAGNSNASQRTLTKADGSPVNVKVAMDPYSLNQGITNNADVIMVRGTISGLSTVKLNNNQTITGTNYSFDNGKILTLPGAGTLNNQGSNSPLLQVANNNTITNLNLQVDPGQIAIQNANGKSVGQLNINGINTNGRINIAINDSSKNSSIILQNNTVNIGDVNGASSSDVVSAVGLDISNHTQATATMTNNRIVVGDNNSAGYAYGVSSRVYENSKLDFTGGLNNNFIQVGNNNVGDYSIMGAVFNTARNNSIINYSGGVDGNHLTMGEVIDVNSYGFGIYNNAFQGSQINFNGGYINNTIDVGHYIGGATGVSTSGIYNYVLDDSAINYDGFHGNKVNIDSSGSAYADYTDATSHVIINVGAGGTNFPAANNGDNVVEDIGSAGNTEINS